MGGQWEGSGLGGGGVRVDVNEIEVFVKIQKKIWGGGRGGRWGGRVGGQSGYERRIEVFVKIQKKKKFGGGGVGGRWGGGGWGSGWGVRVDVIGELKFL